MSRKKKPVAEAPAPPTVPEMPPCPRCLLPVEAGRDPGGMAWHDCDTVLELRRQVEQASEVLTVEAVEQAILHRIRASVPTAKPNELPGLLKAVREASGKNPTPEAGNGKGTSQGLRRWLDA